MEHHFDAFSKQIDQSTMSRVPLGIIHVGKHTVLTGHFDIARIRDC